MRMPLARMLAATVAAVGLATAAAHPQAPAGAFKQDRVKVLFKCSQPPRDCRVVQPAKTRGLDHRPGPGNSQKYPKVVPIHFSTRFCTILVQISVL